MSSPTPKRLVELGERAGEWNLIAVVDHFEQRVDRLHLRLVQPAVIAVLAARPVPGVRRRARRTVSRVLGDSSEAAGAMTDHRAPSLGPLSSTSEGNGLFCDVIVMLSGPH